MKTHFKVRPLGVKRVSVFFFRCVKRPREGTSVSLTGTDNGAGNIRCAAMVVFATIVMKWLH